MNKERVLLVDDDPRILESFSRRLMRQGFVVETASSGEEALLKLPEFLPDLVISDMRMPGIDGAMVMKHIPERDGYFPGRIIFTAFDDGEAIELAKVDEGGVFRVEKDHWETDLQVAIVRALEFRKLRLKAWEQGKEIVHQETEINKLRFLHSVATTFGHETNNPLQAITLANGILIKHFGDNRENEIIGKSVQNIKNAAEKLANLSEIKETKYAENVMRIELENED